MPYERCARPLKIAAKPPPPPPWRRTGQLRQLQDETGVLRDQRDVSADELQSARGEVKALKRALEEAAAERDRDAAAVQANLATASKDLDKWRQAANKYEREIGDLQRDLQQQSKQWQKTAEIQGADAHTDVLM